MILQKTSLKPLIPDTTIKVFAYNGESLSFIVLALMISYMKFEFQIV